MKAVLVVLFLIVAVASPRADWASPNDDEYGNHSADLTLRPADPAKTRLVGYSMAVIGVGMAASGMGLFGGKDDCAVIVVFSCDPDRRNRELWLFGGGAIVGSLGAGLVWATNASSAATVAPEVGKTGEPKNRAVGMGLGLAGSIMGTWLVWSEPTVGKVMLGIAAPSLGQIYAGTVTGTALALMTRGVGGVMMVDSYLDCGVGSSQCEPDYGVGRNFFLAGVAISLYDTWTAVSRSQRLAGGGSVPNVSLGPVLLPIAPGQLAPGLAFTARF